MKIIKTADYNEMSRKAANLIGAQVIMKPNCILGLATGSSPIGTYKELIKRCEEGDLDFSQVKSVNLDEYKGLPRDNDQSYYYFMNHNLFDHINIDKANTHVPNGMEPDAAKECANYEELIKIEANKRFFESADDVPRQAYTMGIGTIMSAKKIVVVVSGEDKADIVKRAFSGPVTPSVPASILQMHPDVTVICDAAAYSKVEA